MVETRYECLLPISFPPACIQGFNHRHVHLPQDGRWTVIPTGVPSEAGLEAICSSSRGSALAALWDGLQIHMPLTRGLCKHRTKSHAALPCAEWRDPTVLAGRQTLLVLGSGALGNG